MTDPFAAVDPFAPTSLDEETELRALVRAIHLSEGFKLIFARCNQVTQRRRLMDEARARLSDRNVQVISLTGPVDHLLDELRKHVASPVPDAVFVTGLEYSLPTAAEAHQTKFVANLNSSRNSFPRVFPCPLVLWVSEYILTALTLGAPDFFSIRSGIYYFAAAPGDVKEIAGSLPRWDAWTVKSLSVSEKQERIAALENLLSDYELLPADRRDYFTELVLHHRLGVHFTDLGFYSHAKKHLEQLLILARGQADIKTEIIALITLGYLNETQWHWVEAERIYLQALEIDRETNNPTYEKNLLNNLGNLYRKQGRLTEAESFLKQSLTIERDTNDRVGEGVTLLNLGLVHHAQNNLSQAKEYFQQSLVISREAKNWAIVAQALGSLGLLYKKEDKFAEAEDAFQESLTILSNIGDFSSLALTFIYLGAIREQEGRLKEAEKYYEESLKASRKISNHGREGYALKRLANLRAQQGDLAGALDLMRQAVEAFKATEDANGLNDTQALLEELERAALAEGIS